MVMINVVYNGELRCTATHTPSGSELITDAPLDNHGKAESFSPTDLVATALGSCVLTVMGIAARKAGISIEGAKISVNKEMVASPVRRIGSLKVSVYIPSAGISAEHKKLLEDTANNCPVHKSLNPDINSPIEFFWE